MPATGGESIEVLKGWLWDTHKGAQLDPREERVVYSSMNKSAVTSTRVRHIASGNEVPLDRALNNPKWSPDGTLIVGNEYEVGRQRDGDIFVCEPVAGECRKLARGYQANWSIDGSFVYFLRPGDRPAGADLYRISRETGAETGIAELYPLHPSIHFYDVSREGTIAYTRFKSSEPELWLADLTR
jgi:hypothetical protein